MSFGNLLKDVKSQIRETDVETLRKTVEAQKGKTGDGQRRRAHPDRRAREGRVGRRVDPRRALDSARVSRAADRGSGSRKVVGDRPLLRGRDALGAGGARAGELGYTNVKSLAGGFSAWKRAGLPFDRPFVMTQEQSLRYARHTMLPEMGEAGQTKLLQLEGAAARRRRARLAGGALPGGGRRRHRSASSTTTWSTRRTCSGRSSTPPIASGCPRSSRRRSPSPS